jgi:hypothetical protein
MIKGKGNFFKQWCRATIAPISREGTVRGVARYNMKCRHNLWRGIWGLKAPAGPGQSPGGGFRGGGRNPQRKTMLSVNRCTNGAIWTIKDMKYILFFIMETIQKSKLLIYFCWIWELLTECFYIAFQNNSSSYKNSASQSIESIFVIRACI